MDSLEPKYFEGFAQPSITLLSGSSGSGKTSLVREFLLNDFIKRVHKIVVLCEYPNENHYQQIITLIISQNPDAKIIDADSKNLDQIIGNLKNTEINYVLIDDKLNDTKDNFKLGKIAAVDSRHKNCTTFCITQNLFNDEKNFRHFRKQVRYFMLFTEDGDRSLMTFLRQAFPSMDFTFKDLPKTKWILVDKTARKFYKDDFQEIYL